MLKVSNWYITNSHFFFPLKGNIRFIGTRKRTKFVLQRRMYSELVASWLREHQQATEHCLLLDETEHSRDSSVSHSAPVSASTSASLPRHSPFEDFTSSNHVNMEELHHQRVEVVVDDRECLVQNDDPFFPSHIGEPANSDEAPMS